MTGILFVLIACGGGQAEAPAPTRPAAPVEPAPVRPPPPTVFANVDGAIATGNPGAYRFNVTVESPDLGCDNYSDWWEVLTVDGDLLYRRILGHSHVEEQPFTRAGGPVSVGPDDTVVVRAHQNPGGYGGTVLRGTVRAGFEREPAQAGWALELAAADPQPDDCRW